MTSRPGINSIEILANDILEGMVRLHAEEMRRQASPDPLLARNFVMKAYRHINRQLLKTREDLQACQDTLALIRQTVPCISLPDSSVDIDDVVEWLCLNGIQNYSFAHQAGMNHFFFSSWDDATLCKLKWC